MRKKKSILDVPRETGCLLVHGYGGSPLEMEGLAEALAKEGFAVRNISLPGHGEDKDNFSSSRFNHWLGCAENAFDELAAQCGRVVVIGLSMGGTLALNIAARKAVAGVVSLASPVHILNFFPWPLAMARFYALSALEQLKRRLSGFFAAAKGGEVPHGAAPWQGYAGPLNLLQLLSFRTGCEITRHLLPRVTAPALIMHDARDRLVYCANAWDIARGIASRENTLVLTRIQEKNTRRHRITMHSETAAFVAERVLVFARQCAKE